MRRRPTLGDRVTYVLARAHAQRVYARFVAATRKATRVQEQVLLAKIRRNAESAFGRDYGFDAIRTPEDFVRKVPVLRYEDHAPYIEQVKAGNLRAMFGGRQRVHMFALTSGTTSAPKYIPVTDTFLAEYRSGWNAFGIKALLDHPHAFLRQILQVSSRMDESRTSAGIPCGAISGLMAATQKRLVRKYYVSPMCAALIEDPLARYYTVMRLAVPTDVAFMITASPATQLKLARTADEHREQLIRDVRDGTLWGELAVPPAIRDQLAPRLKPDRAAAARLEAIASEHGRLLPKHYWELAFLANWTGGTMGLYLQDFPEIFGDVPIRDIGLMASEGRITIPVENGTAAGVLDVTSQFVEFVPRDEIDAASPRTLRSHQLEIGEEYFLLLTTSSGLYRYSIGDLVRCTGWFNAAPMLEFLNKGEHTCSLAGEKLTEHQVMLAMNAAARQVGCAVSNFILSPRWDRPPHYVLHVEAVHATAVAWCGTGVPPVYTGETPVPHATGAAGRRGCKEQASSLASTAGGIEQALAAALDEQLRAVNVEYAGKRSSQRLGAVALNVLPADFLAEWDHRQSDRRRKGNEQYKHQYLLCRPGEDAELPHVKKPE